MRSSLALHITFATAASVLTAQSVSLTDKRVAELDFQPDVLLLDREGRRVLAYRRFSDSSDRGRVMPRIAVCDLDKRKILAQKELRTCSAVAFDGTAVYVASYAPELLSRLSAATLEREARLFLDERVRQVHVLPGDAIGIECKEAWIICSATALERVERYPGSFPAVHGYVSPAVADVGPNHVRLGPTVLDRRLGRPRLLFDSQGIRSLAQSTGRRGSSRT